MKTLKGPGIFVAQFVDDVAPFNSWATICKWASDLGYIYPVEKRVEPNFSYKLSRSLYPILKPLFGTKFSITSHQLAEGIFTSVVRTPDGKILENHEILNYIHS